MALTRSGMGAFRPWVNCRACATTFGDRPRSWYRARGEHAHSPTARLVQSHLGASDGIDALVRPLLCILSFPPLMVRVDIQQLLLREDRARGKGLHSTPEVVTIRLQPRRCDVEHNVWPAALGVVFFHQGGWVAWGSRWMGFHMSARRNCAVRLEQWHCEVLTQGDRWPAVPAGHASLRPSRAIARACMVRGAWRLEGQGRRGQGRWRSLFVRVSRSDARRYILLVSFGLCLARVYHPAVYHHVPNCCWAVSQERRASWDATSTRPLDSSDEATQTRRPPASTG